MGKSPYTPGPGANRDPVLRMIRRAQTTEASSFGRGGLPKSKGHRMTPQVTLPKINLPDSEDKK